MPTRFKWKTDVEKSVVTLNFERRGWQCANSNLNSNNEDRKGWEEKESAGGSDWNFYWASVGSVRAIFSADNGTRLSDMQ